MKRLFDEDGYLVEWLRRRSERADDAIHATSADRVLETPETDLVESVYEQFAVAPLTLGEPYTHGTQDAQVDVRGDFMRGTERSAGPVYVRGTRLEVRVPFTGHPDLWDLRANTSLSRLPWGEIRGNELVLTFDEPADTLRPETFGIKTKSALTDIERLIAFAAADCEQFNRELRGQLAAAVTARKKKVIADQNILEFLPIPVRPRGSTDPAAAVALPPRRKPSLAVNPAAKPYVAEPAISSEDYAAILQAIRDWGLAAERMPETFSPLPEEALRDNLLVSLNGQFGAIGAEMFSRQGKTDILIQQPGGAVFIAECKFWDGPRAFMAAVDQLLGYLVWRDTKSALVLFIREGDVTSIIAKANEAIKGHARYKRPATAIAGSPLHILRQEQDASREIEVAVIVVPLPASKGAKPPGKSSGNGQRRRAGIPAK